MVIDAGGGTVDLSTYTIATCTPLCVEEVSTPGCELGNPSVILRLTLSSAGILQGSTRVNARARSFLEGFDHSSS